MSQPFIGEIRMFAGNFAPLGWALCDGGLYPISGNDALFNLIGTTYGGDGQSTFAVPDLQSRSVVGTGSLGAASVFSIGQTGGVESVTLTTNNLPAHSHAMPTSTGTQTSNRPTNASLTIGNSYNSTTDVIGVPTTVTGGGQPHDNRQPFLAINFIISLFGIYPNQT